MARLKRFSDFLGLRRSTVGMLSMVILVGMGERMAERFLPIYLMALGGGALSIGLLNGVDNLLSALYSFPGGYLSDRIGTKRALLLFNVVAMCGFLVVILIPAWQAVLVGAVFFLSWSAISLPATMSLVAKVLPMNKRTMGVSMHSLVRRIPMALGPILGGLCIGIWGERNGVRLAFVAAFLVSLVAAVLQQALIEDDPPHTTGKGRHLTPEKNPLRLWRQMSSSLKRLLVSDILVRFCEQIPYAFVVVWCMKTIALPVTALQFGILTSIEMATAFLVYIPVAYFADRSAKKPFIVMTFVFFTLFPLVLLFCRSFAWLVLAFIVRGLKEFGEPTRKALIMDLAPEDRKAAMFGLYYLLRDVIVSVAAFGGAFLWQIGPHFNFLVAFSCGLAGTAGFALWGRDLKRDAFLHGT
ncbi:MAG: MFS transporter [Desulfobacterales bacterium C00003060]|nr:MAG: MFS transporter [Desulfobacterales bacterium S3730MH5]OEU77691.1 MAG: MFS transporter [Desulfobacterales bacterium C00003060]